MRKPNSPSSAWPLVSLPAPQCSFSDTDLIRTTTPTAPLSSATGPTGNSPTSSLSTTSWVWAAWPPSPSF